MTGDERFLLDSFTDDVVSNSRYVDLNTDNGPWVHVGSAVTPATGPTYAAGTTWSHVQTWVNGASNIGTFSNPYDGASPSTFNADAFIYCKHLSSNTSEGAVMAKKGNTDGK